MCVVLCKRHVANTGSDDEFQDDVGSGEDPSDDGMAVKRYVALHVAV